MHLFYYGGHYSWVKHPTRLFHRHSKYNGRKYFCDSCLQPFSSTKTLKEHHQICLGVEEVAQRIQMPADNCLAYADHQKQLQVPYVIYADFEALVTKKSDTAGSTEKDCHT